MSGNVATVSQGSLIINQTQMFGEDRKVKGTEGGEYIGRYIDTDGPIISFSQMAGLDDNTKSAISAALDAEMESAVDKLNLDLSGEEGTLV